MVSRYERMLNAIANGEQITEEPTCRIEIFLKALANKEDPSKLPEPRSREEKYWLSIIKGEQITSKPISKKEEYLKAIANNEPIPSGSGTFARVEPLFRKILGETGGSDEPTTNLNYVSGGTFYIREAYSATQSADTITLR